MLRLAILLLLLFAAASCAPWSTGTARRAPTNGGEVYRAGEIEIRIYGDRDRMVRDLPPVLRAVDSAVRVLGYYDRANKIVYSIDDTRVLIHELKHYLEPEWSHGSSSLTTGGVNE